MMAGARWMVPLVWLALAPGRGAEPAPAPLRARSSFAVQSTLLLSELAGAPRDVGYRLSGRLDVQPLHAEQDELLLAFRVHGLQLEVRGAHARAAWQPRGAPWGHEGHEGGHEGGWRALWRGGALADLWLPAGAPRDALNYMRALTGLFQFQVSEGQRNETDISGECEVTYETLSPTVFRKTKRRCAWEAGAAAGGVRARRVARYTLAGGGAALHALHAEELVWLPAYPLLHEEEGEERAGVKARSWHALELLAGEPRPAAPAHPEDLRRAELPLPPDELDAEEEDAEEEELAGAVARAGEALGGAAPGEGGSRAAAEQLSPLLSALRGASAAELSALLAREDLQDQLPGLCRALGLAGSAAGWAAARGFLAPAAEDALEAPALHYLAGLALAPRPHPAVAEDVLALADQAARPALASAALLAGAAAAGRAGPEAALRARDRLARELARARGPEARAPLLVALGNLRLAECTPLLLAAAERGAGAEAEAALGALRGAALSPAMAERALALAADGARGLAERALALELGAGALCAASARAVPLALVRLARALGGQAGAAAGELRRVLWQRLDALRAEGGEALAALWRVLPRDLTTWDARAPPGTSSVLRRRVGWRAGRLHAELLSAQLAERALLRRGRVALRAGGGGDLLAVEVWTGGLDSLVGEEVEGDEAVAAGLRVEAGGVALRPLPLFSGRAELLGHVWAGTGAAPAAVLRALLPAAPWRARVPLQAGAALALRGEGAAALALDAQGSVSLWQRAASTRLVLRAAAHAQVAAAVRVRGAELRAQAALGGEARLRIASELDFYDEVALCVRADVAPHRMERSASLQSRCGPRVHRVRRVRSARWSRAGRSLALGRANDAVCRARAATDAEGDL